MLVLSRLKPNVKKWPHCLPEGYEQAEKIQAKLDALQPKVLQIDNQLTQLFGTSAGLPSVIKQKIERLKYDFLHENFSTQDAKLSRDRYGHIRISSTKISPDSFSFSFRTSMQKSTVEPLEVNDNDPASDSYVRTIFNPQLPHVIIKRSDDHNTKNALVTREVQAQYEHSQEEAFNAQQKTIQDSRNKYRTSILGRISAFLGKGELPTATEALKYTPLLANTVEYANLEAFTDRLEACLEAFTELLEAYKQHMTSALEKIATTDDTQDVRLSTQDDGPVIIDEKDEINLSIFSPEKK